MSWVISATVVTDNAERVVRASEVFARAVAGLALEGMVVSVHISESDDDDLAEDPDEG